MVHGVLVPPTEPALRKWEATMAEFEVQGKGGTVIKVKSAALGGVVLVIYTGEGEASAPAVWLENQQAIEELAAAVEKAQNAEG
jgi:hypothetical protein